MPKGMGYGKGKSKPAKQSGGSSRQTQKGIGKSNKRKMGRTGTKSK